MVEFRTGFHHGRRGQLIFKHPIYIHPSAYIDCTSDVTIGRGVSISRNTRIYTHDHFHDGMTIEEDVITNRIKTSALDIGDDVYIGDGVIILACVNQIGGGAVIGAGSVVTCDVPSQEIWCGNPAKRINDRKQNKEI